MEVGPSCMNPDTTMLLVGLVTCTIGTMMNVNPVKFNESIFGKNDPANDGSGAAMRLTIGGGILGIGLIGLFNSQAGHDVESAKTIVLSMGIALSAFLTTIVAGKLRNFTEHVPLPPAIILPILSALCFYTALI